ncbi:MAG TPA: sulfatase-like hydrolase/transferase [Pirellulales bacterium]|jgi:arylsulfatase A-like enzyme|nr:sulfatase-like hydrolase/transferase [Pirellulales bacterium]
MPHSVDSNQRPNIICVAIDRLHIGHIGAYGNAWVRTPALDQLAAESLVLDRAVIDSPHLEVIYRSLWLGLHALCPNNHESQRQHLATILSQAGWHTALLSDDRTVASHPLAIPFAERIFVESSSVRPSSNGNNEIAENAVETDAAAIFAATGNWLEVAQRPFFLWIHTGTLGQIWDAPVEFRRQFVGEDDPPAGSWTNVPNRILSQNFDPDELLAIVQAYAGQVSLIDQFIYSLLQAIKSTENVENTLIVCFSPRGFPLGEHSRVGACDDALYAELVHVPWIIRLPKRIAKPGRLQHLVQPADMPYTILDCCNLDADRLLSGVTPSPDNSATSAGFGRSILDLLKHERLIGSELACAVSLPDQKFLATIAWSLRLSDNSIQQKHLGENATSHQSVPRAELFAKPDDWFEVNEISNLCPNIAEAMQTALNQFTAACQTGLPATLAKLGDELTNRCD